MVQVLFLVSVGSVWLINSGQIRYRLFLVVFLLSASLAKAAFTHPARWKLDSIEETYASTWCFHSGPNPTLKSTCANTMLNALLNFHLNNELGAGLSIAYYDLKDGSVLGGAGWSGWRVVERPVGLCMSGAVTGLDNAFRTICRFATTDDDLESPDTHAQECMMSRAQLRVTDGCYTPSERRGLFRLDDTATSIFAIFGLLIALPGMFYGVYRWYCARRSAQQMRADGRLNVPLYAGDGVARLAESRTDPARLMA